MGFSAGEGARRIPPRPRAAVRGGRDRRPGRPSRAHAFGPAGWRRHPDRSRLGARGPGASSCAPRRADRGPGADRRHRCATAAKTALAGSLPTAGRSRISGTGTTCRPSNGRSGCSCCPLWSKRMPRRTQAACRSAAGRAPSCPTITCSTPSPGTASPPACSSSGSASAWRGAGNDEGAAAGNGLRPAPYLHGDRARRLGARDRLRPRLSRLADVLRPLGATAGRDPARCRLRLRPGDAGVGAPPARRRDPRPADPPYWLARLACAGA